MGTLGPATAVCLCGSLQVSLTGFPDRESQTTDTRHRRPATHPAPQGLRCVYPPEGGRASVEVWADDLSRLADDEFLNDTVIDFYMK